MGPSAGFFTTSVKDGVVTGTPEEVAKCSKSYTGEFLKKILDENK